MEQKIEGAIDQGLENISSGLYLISVLAGIILILSGLVLLFKQRKSSPSRMRAGGMLCIILGAAALISGFLQM